MIKQLFRTFFPRSEGHEGIATPQGVKALFLLRYNKLLIGRLWLDEGVWHFAYSSEFKGQDVVKPIVGFGDIERVYESPSLWPFFSIRIPSLEQPRIQEAIKKERLPATDEVALLARFGQSSTSNPFSLEPTAVNA